jgi:hypothetical protein
MPDEYARAIHELVKAKVEHRAPEVQIGPQGKPTPQVINIMMLLSRACRGMGKPRCAMPYASKWARLSQRRPRRDPHGGSHAAALTSGEACIKAETYSAACRLP